MDGTDILAQGRIGMGFQAFHTQDRSRFEQQPIKDSLGNILVFDGRLDNHQELTEEREPDDGTVTDSALVLGAFAKWGEDCFSHLVGDWALALWSAKSRVLYLARDHAGARTLFYRDVNGEICWSTYLETFLVGCPFPDLDREYMARVLSSQEIRDLTPYKDVRAVSPAHYIVIREGQVLSRPHWRWIADARIACRSDDEYDEYFIHLFRQAVERRIGPGSSVLAELSGGMDSSSIVCMADQIVRNSTDRSDLVDTISYYDDTEPNWDERPYFTAVETHRNKRGIHLDCSSRIPSYEPLVLQDRVYPYPGGDRISLEVANQFEQSVGAGRYRVILSGIGGDELLGGVPTPMPELANYLRAGQLLKFVLTAAEWCMVSRQPLIHMLHNAVAFTGNLYKTPRTDPNTIPPWLSAELRQMSLCSNRPQESRHELLPARPSAIANGRTWWSILETLPHLAPNLLGCYEYRYPYLDRDLVEFLHRIPRDQLVRPGRRRFLMRRALKRVVPTEILERKRKAYMSHGPLTRLRNAQPKIEELFSNPLSADYGLIDRDRFLLAFRTVLAGDLKWIGALTKAIGVELWLQSIKTPDRNFGIRWGARGLDEVLPVTDGQKRLRADRALLALPAWKSAT
jgi:asparagine synthase (glutamine-hydrolysing)